jgi:sugar lactone lactonase YvrE
LGNNYITDSSNNRIRRVDVATKIITTIGGTRGNGYNGDGIPFTSAQLDYPYGIGGDKMGWLFISDQSNHRIRAVKLDNATQLVWTISGTGSYGYNGDGMDAREAYLAYPSGLHVDEELGDVYFADTNNHRIRKVSRATGQISTIAGNGGSGYSGDGGQATATTLYYPNGVYVDRSSNTVYIADSSNHLVRKVSLLTGVIVSVAGVKYNAGWNGDNILAKVAMLNYPTAVQMDSEKRLYIMDTNNFRVRVLEMVNGKYYITTAIGNGGQKGILHPLFIRPISR